MSGAGTRGARLALLDRVVGETKLADLEHQDPAAQAFLDALDQIRGAVAHHMYEEENGRLLDIKQLPAAEQLELTRRYQQEFDRYLLREPRGHAATDTGSRTSAH